MIMKNKKMLYILIPATLVVWGLIIYRIIGGMGPSDAPVFQQAAVPVAIAEAEKDTFSIHPTYRDPFLGKRSVPAEQAQTHETTVKPATPPPAPVVKTPTPWPTIQYSGTIKNQASNKERVLLQVNGQDFMAQAGETVNGVLVYKVYRDSIEVHFLNEKKFIHK
jgi:hypothetical protein